MCIVVRGTRSSVGGVVDIVDVGVGVGATDVDDTMGCVGVVVAVDGGGCGGVVDDW